jgi:hypothetical protein
MTAVGRVGLCARNSLRTASIVTSIRCRNGHTILRGEESRTCITCKIQVKV